VWANKGFEPPTNPVFKYSFKAIATVAAIDYRGELRGIYTCENSVNV
jgi:hypothetical protein